MGSEGQSKFSSLCSRSSTYYPTCESHKFYLFFYFCSSAGMRVCSYPTLFQSVLVRQEHYVTIQGLIDRMRPQLVLIVGTECVYLTGTQTRSNRNTNLLMQQKAWQADFTFSFGATPDAASSCLCLFSL